MTGPWPLGINPDMDDHAINCGLAHWSATSATHNEWWIRRDGLPHRCRWDMNGGYPAELRALDARHPPKPWVFGVIPQGSSTAAPGAPAALQPAEPAPQPPAAPA